jgi:NADH:ubiquinone oxidoreductase subunit H
MPELLFQIAIIVAKIVVLTFMVVLPLVPVSVYFERRFSAVIQDRVGPNRVGIPLTLLGFKKDFHLFGLIQPIADGLKLFLKEDFTPAHVRKAFYWMAPALTVVPALITVCVVPFGSPISIFGHTEKLVIADLDIGTLFVFSVASLSVYGITLAGWSSNSKFPFIGGVRSTAQMISYEIALGLSIIPVLMYYGDLNLSTIVQQQADHGWLLLPLWGHDALIITLFLGGWSIGFGLDAMVAKLHIGDFYYGGLIHLGCFMTKLIGFILFFILVRWTVPRFRYDQLMKLGWVVFFEAALINVFLAALIVAAPQLEKTIIGVGAVLLVIVTAAVIWVAKVSEEHPKVLRA